MVTKYPKSRPQEGGRLATYKSDFFAHTEGIDFRHGADQIDMNPPLPSAGGVYTANNVQETLELMANVFITAGQGFITIGDGYDSGDITIGDPGIANLQDAFNAAFLNPRLQNGGIILVKAGSYQITGTVTVPVGISIMGEPTGTNIVAVMSEQPVFIFQKSNGNFDIGGGTPTVQPVYQNRLFNIGLFDNLNGAEPSMSAVPMIQCNRGSNVVIERCTIVGKAATNATHRVIGYAGSSGAAGTILHVKDCFFDGINSAVDFDNTEGSLDYLTVEGTRARTFGGDVNIYDRCFVSFSNSNVVFTNNFHQGVSASPWDAEACFVIKNVGVGNTNTTSTIIGNIGGLTTLNGVGDFLVDTRTVKTTIVTVNTGNAWGKNFNNSFYVTIGDGQSNMGDVNGPNALDVILANLNINLVTTVYVLPGEYNVTVSNASGFVKLIGVSSFAGLPVINMAMSANLRIDSCYNIEFIRDSATVQNVQTFFGNLNNATYQTFVAKNCNFINTTLLISPSTDNIDYIIDSCFFNQTGTYSDIYSLRSLEGSANSCIVKNCSFNNYGYSILLPLVTKKDITIDGCLFNQFANGVNDNKVRSIPAGFTSTSYIEIGTSALGNDIKFINNKINGIFSPSTTGAAINPSITSNFNFNNYISILGSDVIINNNKIYAPNQIFTYFGYTHPMASVKITPRSSIFFSDNIVFGSLPLQISGSQSKAAAAFPDVNALTTTVAKTIVVSDSSFLYYDTAGSSAINKTAIDIDVTTFVTGLSSTPSIIISNCLTDNESNVSTTNYCPQHYTNTSTYLTQGAVQVYASGWDVKVHDNKIKAQFAAIPAIHGDASLVNCAGLFIYNYHASSNSSRCANTFVQNNHLYFVHAPSAPTQETTPLFVYTNTANIIGNRLFRSFCTQSNPFDSSLLSLRTHLSSAVPRSLIANNSFDMPDPYGSSNAVAQQVKLAGYGNGSITDNVFMSPRNSQSVSSTNIINDTSVFKWYSDRNHGQRFTHTQQYNSGQFLYYITNSLPGTEDIPSKLSSLRITENGDWRVGLTSDSNTLVLKYKVDLSTILPPRSKIISIGGINVTRTLAGSGTGAITASLNRHDDPPVVLATQTVSLPSTSGSSLLSLGSQGSPIGEFVEDLYVEIYLSFQSGQTGSMTVSPFIISYEY